MKLKANAHGAPCFGRDGLVGKSKPLLSGFACARPIPIAPNHHFQHGHIGRPTPDPLLMYIGDAGIEEPMWVYLDFMRRSHREHQFHEHPTGVREITGLTLTTPAPLRSIASQRIVESSVLATREGPKSLLEIGFDGNRRNKKVDFRPHLPLVFQL